MVCVIGSFKILFIAGMSPNKGISGKTNICILQYFGKIGNTE